jgi:hypothetical protein
VNHDFATARFVFAGRRGMEPLGFSTATICGQDEPGRLIARRS